MRLSACPWLAERVMEKTRIRREHLHVIPHGIEIERFTVGKPPAMKHAGVSGLTPDAWWPDCSDASIPRKDRHSDPGRRRLHRLGHRPHLLLVGDQSFEEGDQYAREIHDLVGPNAFGDYIHFFPHQEDIEWAYAALDVFVLASKSECYGMVTVEALVSDYPLSAPMTGHHKPHRTGRNGFLSNPATWRRSKQH